MKNTLKNIKKYPVIIFFGFVLYAISIGDLFSPVYERSDLENRELAKFPKFSISSLMKNKYNADIETFTTDHFIGRNTWISIKSVAESAIGKQENNGVVYGKGGYMFTKVLTPDYKQLDKNLKAVEKFMERHSDRTVTFMAVPTAPGVLTDLVYKDSPVVDCDYILEQGENTVKSGKFLNIKQVLQEHRNDYIYYRTDHHWTALGAYYAYQDFCKVKGIEAESINSFETMEFPGFVGSFYASSNQVASLKENPDTVTAYIPKDTNDMFFYDSSLQKINWKIINDVSEYSENSKYATFIAGDEIYAQIDNQVLDDGSSCVVIKESFGDAFIPFLVDHYQHIYIVDYRYFYKYPEYNNSVYELVKDKNVQDVIFINNASAMTTEKSAALMSELFD